MMKEVHVAFKRFYALVSSPNVYEVNFGLYNFSWIVLQFETSRESFKH